MTAIRAKGTRIIIWNDNNNNNINNNINSDSNNNNNINNNNVKITNSNINQYLIPLNIQSSDIITKSNANSINNNNIKENQVYSTTEITNIISFKSSNYQPAANFQIYDTVSSYRLLFRTVVLTKQDQKSVITLMISIFIYYPLARIEILTNSKENFVFENQVILNYFYQLGYRDSINILTIDNNLYKLNLYAAILTPFMSTSTEINKIDRIDRIIDTNPQSTILLVIPPNSCFISTGLYLLTHQLSVFSNDFMVVDGCFMGKLDVKICSLKSYLKMKILV